MLLRANVADCNFLICEYFFLGVSIEIRELDSLTFDAENVDLRAVTEGWALVFCFTRRGAGSRRSSPPPGEIRLVFARILI